MPTFQPTPYLTMHYEIDDFTDPWRQPETVLPMAISHMGPGLRRDDR
jgi:hypothetical protein